MNAQEFSEKVLEAQTAGNIVKLVDKELEAHNGGLDPDGYYSIKIVTPLTYKGMHHDIKQVMLSKEFINVEILASGYFGKPPEIFKVKFKLPSQGE